MRRNLGWMGLAFYGGMLGLSLSLSWWFPDLLGWRWTGPRGPAWEVAVGLAVGTGVVLATLGLVQWTAHGYWLSRRLALATRSLPTWSLAPLALAAGLAEEAFFRGTFWAPFEFGLGPAWGPPVALIFTSVIFAWSHGSGRPGLRTWTLFALITSMVIGVLRWWTGSLLGPMVAHALVDLVNLPLLRFWQRPIDEEP